VEERAEQITELARALMENNEVPREEIVATLANLTTFSEDYVRRLLPDRFKIRAGIGGAGTHKRVGLAPTQQEDVAFIEETDRRDLRHLLKQSPVSPVANPEIVVEDEEPMTVEQYVADVLMHNPEVEPAKLVAVTAEMFGVSEDFAQNLIDNQGQRRGRKRSDPYAMRSPRILCPLCGRQNAEINKLHMILDATPPEVTLVKWLREVLT